MKGLADDPAVRLLADILGIRLSLSGTGSLLIAEGEKKFAVGGINLRVPYDIVSSQAGKREGAAAVVLHVGGEESSLNMLLATSVFDSGRSQHARLFVLDSRGMPGIGFEDWLEREKFGNLEDMFRGLRELGPSVVKKNFIWSHAKKKWNAGPSFPSKEADKAAKTAPVGATGT